MSFEVRRIRETEATLLREVRIASLLDSPFAFGASIDDERKKSSQTFESDAHRLATSETSAQFIAFDQGEVIGQIGAYLDSGDAWVCAMWVAPSMRRNHVGRELFACASRWLRGRGASDIYAWVADSNSNALAFYQRLGFVATAKTQALPSNPLETETLFVFGQESGQG